MKYVGRLVLLAQATLVAGWVNAGTVTVNNLNCGSTVGNVTISANGDIKVTTTDATSCAPGTSTPGGPYTVTVNRTGTGTLGVVTGTGIDCGGAGGCSTTVDSGGSITLAASEPTGTDTFAWSGACTGSNLTCTISNITVDKSVTATYNAVGTPTTGCPDGTPANVKCFERPWPTFAQETVTMKPTDVFAFKVTTTGSGAVGLVSTMDKTGVASGSRTVGLSTSPGVFSTSGGRACVQAPAEVTSNRWTQGVAKTGYCLLPANSTAWINIRFESCSATSCSFFLKAS